jgi:ankyrin repeat protein
MDGNEAVVKLLLDTGKAQVDSKDEKGQTPLSWAVRRRLWVARRRNEVVVMWLCMAVVKLLLDKGKSKRSTRGITKAERRGPRQEGRGSISASINFCHVKEGSNYQGFLTQLSSKARQSGAPKGKSIVRLETLS